MATKNAKGQKAAVKAAQSGAEDEDILDQFLNVMGDMPMANVSRTDGTAVLEFPSTTEALDFSRVVSTKLGRLRRMINAKVTGTTVTLSLAPMARQMLRKNPGQIVNLLPIKLVD